MAGGNRQKAGQRNLATSKKNSRRFSCSTLLRLFLVLVISGGCAIVLTTWFQILRSSSSDTEHDVVAEQSHPIQQQSPSRPHPQQQQQLKLPSPVILLGFPKSGTTSIFQFFTCSGVRTQHFCCCNDTSDHPPCQIDTMANCILNNTATAAAADNNNNNSYNNRRPKLLEGCGDYQVYAQIDGERPIKHIRGRPNYKGVLLDDGRLEKHNIKKSTERTLLFRHFLPQHFLLQELHDDYPNATYILSLRDPQQWARSVMNWYQMRGRVVNEYRYFNRSMEKPGKAQAKEWLARIYTEHSAMVRRFVQQQHPSSHVLIEVNITDPAAGKKLADTFGLDERCWGHHNKVGTRGNDEKNRKRQEEQQQQ